MYYYKLIYIFFLLIFINISVGNTKQKNNLLSHRRCKRGNNLRGCFGGGSRGRPDDQPFKQREGKGKAHVKEESEVKGGNSKKRALFVCHNSFYSHLKYNVNL
ncbi:unnamed protein product [Meloidogyne enterolobii]|uniref:Uncharacterized protein n=1 Tax=Meloidogyne enterolobii TaxID=390850 RepID=A0ACB1ADC6_MELEN